MRFSLLNWKVYIENLIDDAEIIFALKAVNDLLDGTLDRVAGVPEFKPLQKEAATLIKKIMLNLRDFLTKYEE